MLVDAGGVTCVVDAFCYGPQRALRLHVPGFGVSEVHAGVMSLCGNKVALCTTTMDLNTLRDAVADMDRRKVNEDVSSAAKSALEAAAAVGTETPMVILTDIRRCIVDLTDVVRRNGEDEAEREIRAERRHQELIATLQQMAAAASNSAATSYRPQSRASVSNSGDKREFYHHDVTISTGAHVIGVILIQIDNVMQNSGQLPEQGSKDAVILDLKGWSGPVTKVAAVESPNTRNRTKVSLPKLSQSETTIALEMVSSTIQGRAQPFNVSRLMDLQQSCPALIGIVEEIRQRLIRCPGIIPEGRRERIGYLRFPYVTKDGDLNVSRVASDYVSAGPLVLDSVPKLKDASKKLYVSEVLEKCTPPIVAYNKAKAIS